MVLPMKLQRITLLMYLSLNYYNRLHANPSATIFTTGTPKNHADYTTRTKTRTIASFLSVVNWKFSPRALFNSVRYFILFQYFLFYEMDIVVLPFAVYIIGTIPRHVNHSVSTQGERVTPVQF